MLRLPLVSCVALLGIAACSSHGPVDKAVAANTAALPAVTPSAASASGQSRGATQSGPEMATSSTPIPASLQGRWGLTPADCTTTKGDAKGLLTITPTDLRFHESRAVPAADTEIDGGTFSGTFKYAGEGRSWSRYEVLTLDGQVLVRTETKPAASFNYAKCS
jgi:hypothetical protein